MVRNTRLAAGIPLGGIGCGTFQVMTDGSISAATINNNWEHPTGDLPGCFAAIWTNAGGRIVTKALALKSAYGLPPISSIEYRGLFPQAIIDYPDTSLPVRLSLRAFSSLIPHDVRGSSLPAALFIFRATNTSRAPVDISIALSWENILGVGGNAVSGAFSDRTGNAITSVPPADGIFGLRFSGPSIPATLPQNRLRYNANGTYALLGQGPAPDALVSAAAWNAREQRPAWWARFEREGMLEGACPPGREGSVDPAGVVAIRITLKDRETRDFPFVFAWHTPRFWTVDGQELGHLYEKSYDDAVQAGRYALDNRLTLAALTEEWQQALLRAQVPPWLARRLINDSAPLFTNTLLTRDSGGPPTNPGPPLFATMEMPSGEHRKLGAMDHRAAASGLVAAWYPGLDLQELREFARAQTSAGEIPRFIGSIDHGLAAPAPSSAPAIDVQASFASQVWRRYLWTGDTRFLNEMYPAAKRAIQFGATLDSGDGLPRSSAVFDRDRRTSGNSYSAVMWLAAARIGTRMADAMQDRRFAAECRAWEERTAAAIRKHLFANGELKAPPLPGDSPGRLLLLTGQWMSDVVEAGDLLPGDLLSEAFESAAKEAGRPEHYERMVGSLPDGSRHGILGGAAVVSLQALLMQRGRTEPAFRNLEALNSYLREAAWSPRTSLAFEKTNRWAQLESSHFGKMASWWFLNALCGFGLDLPAGRITLDPHLPPGQREMSAPLFAPSFVASVEYRPGPRRAYLAFRFLRSIPVAAEPAKLQSGAGIVLKQAIIPAGGPQSAIITASVGTTPVPGKAARDQKGRAVFTFDAPIRLTAGQRLEFHYR